MKRIVHPVFTGEEILSIVAGPSRRFHRRLVQRLHVATSTKGFFASTFDKHRADIISLTPDIQLCLQQIHHFKREGVQGRRDTQCYPAQFA